MHLSSSMRLRWFIVNYLHPTLINATHKMRVLDVGSGDINGSYKCMFDPNFFEYTGLDIEEGPNVDIVVKPYDWHTIETDSYDVVISGQAFEHSEFFWVTMSEMTRVLKKNGLLCVIVPNACPEHRYPVDCYRFYTDGMVALARYNCLSILHAHTNCYSLKETEGTREEWCPFTKEKVGTEAGLIDSILVARKPYEGETKIVNLNEYKCSPIDHNILRGDLRQAEWLH